jgi:hypothetical protein
MERAEEDVLTGKWEVVPRPGRQSPTGGRINIFFLNKAFPVLYVIAI